MFRAENDPILDLVCGGGVEAGVFSSLRNKKLLPDWQGPHYHPACEAKSWAKCELRAISSV